MVQLQGRYMAKKVRMRCIKKNVKNYKFEIELKEIVSDKHFQNLIKKVAGYKCNTLHLCWISFT